MFSAAVDGSGLVLKTRLDNRLHNIHETLHRNTSSSKKEKRFIIDLIADCVHFADFEFID